MDNRSTTYTSVSKHTLQMAFAYAHKLSEDSTVPAPQRIQFRKISDLIWKAHGEPGKPAAGVGQTLLASMSLAALSTERPGDQPDGPTAKKDTL